jgi:Ulp1 family protease
MIHESNLRRRTNFSIDEKNNPFSPNRCPGAHFKGPVQDNHCDCGVYVLEYVERFFETLCLKDGRFNEPDCV